MSLYTTAIVSERMSVKLTAMCVSEQQCLVQHLLLKPLEVRGRCKQGKHCNLAVGEPSQPVLPVALTASFLMPAATAALHLMARSHSPL